jgi:hypothetical protein
METCPISDTYQWQRRRRRCETARTLTLQNNTTMCGAIHELDIPYQYTKAVSDTHQGWDWYKSGSFEKILSARKTYCAFQI